MAQETYGYTSIPEVCVCVSVKRGLSSGKRDLLHTQKRPTDILTYLSIVVVKAEGVSHGPHTMYLRLQVSKRDLSYGKRDLLYGKRDLLYGKRDLL